MVLRCNVPIPRLLHKVQLLGNQWWQYVGSFLELRVALNNSSKDFKIKNHPRGYFTSRGVRNQFTCNTNRGVAVKRLNTYRSLKMSGMEMTGKLPWAVLQVVLHFQNSGLPSCAHSFTVMWNNCMDAYGVCAELNIIVRNPWPFFLWGTIPFFSILFTPFWLVAAAEVNYFEVLSPDGSCICA